jgi:8-oxo-dGTP diphosphatase
MRTAAFFLMRADGAAYLQLRDDKPGLQYPGFWSAPGGHCDATESPEDCARRELLEEAGYRCGELHRLAELDNPDMAEGHQRITLFWTLYDGVQELRCFEGRAMRFVTRNEAESLMFVRFLFSYWDRILAELGVEPVKSERPD